MSRKRLGLFGLSALLAAFVLAIAMACGGETVIETVVVEKQVPVEKVVKETVVVEKEVPVEKIVKETVVVKEQVPVEKVVKETVVIEKQVPVEKVVKQTVVVEKEVPVEKIVKETVVVKEQVPVEKVVRETVVVEKEVPVEKVVKETVVVEKERVVVATPVPEAPTFFGLPIPKPEPVSGEPPEPKNAGSTVVIRAGLELRGGGLPWGYEGHFLGQSVTEKFFTTDKGGNALPMLAESWDLADDLSSLTIKLKEGIPFHGDFGELTADDVVWTLNTGNPGRNPESATDGGSNWVSFIGDQEVVAVDKYTVRIPIKSFDVRWDTFILGDSGLGLSILSKNAYDTMGEDWALNHVVGTGPFEVTDFVRDDHLNLRRVENHYRKTPEVETLIYRAIPDETVAEALLKTGDTDASQIPLRDFPNFTAAGFKIVGAGAGSFHSITFSGNYWETTSMRDGSPITVRLTYKHPLPWIGDPLRPKFGNPPEGMDSMERARLVRQALARAINRDLINKVLFANAGWPNYTYGHDINNPNYDHKWDYPYDPAEAERLLDQAGYPVKADGTRFDLPFFIRLGRGDEEIGTAVAGMWREIGVNVQEFRAQYQVFRPSLIGRSATSPWIHSAGAESPQAPWDWPVMGNSESTLGRGGYNIGLEDRFLGEMYLKLNAEPDKAKRVALRNELADYVHHWAVVIGTIAEPNVALINPKKIASWDMPMSVREAAMHHPEFIELAK